MKTTPYLLTCVALSCWFSTPVVAAEPSVAPAGQKALEADSDPLVREWKAPVFPANLPATVKSGTARIRVVVDETGVVTSARVLKASEPAFGEAALAAVKTWTFSPAQENGKTVAKCLDVPWRFDREHPIHAGLLPPSELTPVAVPRKPAELVDGPLGDFPASLVGRGLNGDVVFRCIVGPDGKAQEVQIQQASHADFVAPAIASSAQWKFKPAAQGDLKVAAELIGQVSYVDPRLPSRAKILTANGITGLDGKDPENAPAIVTLADPAWPQDRLLKGDAVSADVAFTVTASGAVTGLRVLTASDAAFGAALQAALLASTFDGAMSHGQGIDVSLVRHVEYKGIAVDAKPDDADPLTRLVALARANAIGGGKGLDGRIVPVYRVAPVRPAALPEDQKAKAVVEFVIDRDGRARLAHFLEASSDDAGWAAVTAVNQWVFNAPTRGGKPTEVKVKIPLTF